MNAPTFHDRLRDYVSGRMERAAAAEFARELAADPARAAQEREFRAVWSATEMLGTLVPVSRTTWEDVLARDARRRSRTRRVAAAAALLLALGAAAYWISVRPGAPASVIVEAIPLERPSRAPEHEAVPSVLAHYAPTPADPAQGVQWLSDLAEARAVALAVHRPVLVFGYYPTCPWCIALRRDQFREADFVAAAVECVPVAVDLMTLEESEVVAWLERGYPLIELQTAQGDVVATMSGPPGTLDIDATLARGLERWPSEPPALAWSAANELARSFASSLNSESQGRLSDAWRGFTELQQRGQGSLFESAGAAGCDRIAILAHDELLAARELARHDIEGARTRLAAAAQTCAGTPFEHDLRSVLSALERGHAFPELRPR